MNIDTLIKALQDARAVVGNVQVGLATDDAEAAAQIKCVSIEEIEAGDEKTAKLVVINMKNYGEEEFTFIF